MQPRLVSSIVLACLVASVTVQAVRYPFPPNPPSPPKSGRTPIIRLPNPPQPPSPPAGSPPAALCTASMINQYLSTAQSEINSQLAVSANDSTDTTKENVVWDSKGPLDVCTFKGTKVVTNTASGYHALQVSSMNISDVVCNTSVTSAKLSGTLSMAVAFTQSVAFAQHFEWEAKWCPEMGVPTTNRNVYDFSGSINGISGVVTTTFTATVNTTAFCITSIAAQTVKLSYTSAKATMQLIALGTIDVTSKFTSKLNTMINQIDEQVASRINNAAVPLCKAITP